MLPEEQSMSVVQERVVDDVIVLSPERGLKGEVESLLKERIDALVREGRLEILIDMKLMPRIDSSELGRLIRSHISVRQAGGKVRLCNISDKVMMLMKMSKLDTVLDLHRTEEEALASIREHRGGCSK
jgi:anti-anti-sigma factor